LRFRKKENDREKGVRIGGKKIPATPDRDETVASILQTNAIKSAKKAHGNQKAILKRRWKVFFHHLVERGLAWPENLDRLHKGGGANRKTRHKNCHALRFVWQHWLRKPNKRIKRDEHLRPPGALLR